MARCVVQSGSSPIAGEDCLTGRVVFSVTSATLVDTSDLARRSAPIRLKASAAIEIAGGRHGAGLVHKLGPRAVEFSVVRRRRKRRVRIADLQVANADLLLALLHQVVLKCTSFGEVVQGTQNYLRRRPLPLPVHLSALHAPRPSHPGVVGRGVVPTLLGAGHGADHLLVPLDGLVVARPLRRGHPLARGLLQLQSRQVVERPRPVGQVGRPDGVACGKFAGGVKLRHLEFLFLAILNALFVPPVLRLEVSLKLGHQLMRPLVALRRRSLLVVTLHKPHLQRVGLALPHGKLPVGTVSEGAHVLCGAARLQQVLHGG
mmetsp:Transcript_106524/g.243916  ORF Transcript_106524/g.243916 Transcript_106524/m.243916 type:complete len:317 (+) Transcript_106524:132-1082(+)